MRILLIGHSHVNCVAAAAALAQGDDQVARVDVVAMHRDKKGGHEPDVEEYIAAKLSGFQRRQEDYDLVALFLGGNTHNTLGLVQMDPPFDFVLPSHPELVPADGARLIPSLLVEEILRERMGSILSGLTRMKTLFGSRAVCVESPPPIGDDDYVRQYLDEHFREDFSKGRGIVGAEMRFKLWQISCNVFKRHCESIGLDYQARPQETIDQGKYLAKAGYPQNVTHGNEWYGAHVLRGLVARMSVANAAGLT